MQDFAVPKKLGLVYFQNSSQKLQGDGHYGYQKGLHLLCRNPLNDDSLLFSHIDGTTLLPDTITHAWIKLTRRIGLKSVRLHDARHTHASLMLKQGIHPKVVQERLGHSSIQITLDTYSHVAPGMQTAAAKRFDEILLAVN
ncbi:MAG: tyrosine-type recombinase/integrase [Dehalococcoidales bacterium]|nr:tyrosine-type recombinase/integrase [Dehalococcoidales bacterium]